MILGLSRKQSFIKEEEALNGLSQGAQPTATVARPAQEISIMEKSKTVKEKT